MRGSKLIIDITSEVKAGSEETSIDAGLEAGFSGFGVSASASVGFANNLGNSSKLSKTKVLVYATGANSGTGVESLSLDKASEQIVNYASNAPKGTYLSTVL